MYEYDKSIAENNLRQALRGRRTSIGQVVAEIVDDEKWAKRISAEAKLHGNCPGCILCRSWRLDIERGQPLETGLLCSV